MTSLNAKAFRGAVPRTSPRLLDGNYAVECLNFKLGSGCLDPIRGPALVHTSLAASIGTMYRYRNAGLDYWLVWPGTIDVARSPNSQDKYNRLYFTGDGAPRMTSPVDAIIGSGPYPSASYVLGVYVPQTAPTIVITGGSGTINETRSYTHTFVTAFQEEGAPCGTPVVASGLNNATWTLSGLEAPPPNAGTISGATNLGAGLVRLTLDTTRGLQPYEQLNVTGVVGMTDLNQALTINAVPDATHVDVLLNTTQGYTSGGAWARRGKHNTVGMRRRIYRTVGTGTDYKFVAEQDATLTTFADTVAGSSVINPISTLNSWTPPKNGHSLRALANGAHCMLAGNELCVSEIGKPHSWPIANRYTFSGLGVAMVVVGNSALIGTDTFPIVATCTVPEQVTQRRLEDCYAPCVSKPSAVDTGSGMAYASFDGLWHITPSGGVKVTDKLYAKGDWEKLSPASMRAVFSNGYYFATHSRTNGAPRMLVLEWANLDSSSEVDDQFDALYHNPWDGLLYVAKGSKVYQFDADDSNRYLGYWRGPDEQLGPPANFSIAQVHAEYGDIVPLDTTITSGNAAMLADLTTIDGAFGMSPFGLVPVGTSSLLEQPAQTARKVQFSLLSNKQVVFSRDIASSKSFRLPAGFKTEVAAMLITASTRVYSCTIAQGAGELKAASQ